VPKINKRMAATNPPNIYSYSQLDASAHSTLRLIDSAIAKKCKGLSIRKNFVNAKVIRPYLMICLKTCRPIHAIQKHQNRNKQTARNNINRPNIHTIEPSDLSYQYYYCSRIKHTRESKDY